MIEMLSQRTDWRCFLSDKLNTVLLVVLGMLLTLMMPGAEGQPRETSRTRGSAS